ncbi:tryptophan synthase beta subunit-like PLP-dependent enzyme [Diplogelasinospora grovesii]|uniref:Tryptophan synthase beta subunit-like PLP-dependent enzyme n=1 Tax=Diplogelasinospora grovesii TaxID=303347 RepID=A0AAN6NHG6_9PEZI|nr:tryptophan synthase beta subunit-like PLP-dependent enzyme [Diplogelasinospora grovesii]
MADLSTCRPLTRDSVKEAHELIRPYIHQTPVLTNTTLNTIASTPLSSPGAAKPVIRLYFKCENLQLIGAFKVRGAFHAVERLKQDPTWSREKGVVTHSSGNHAQALALAARSNNIKAYVVMPSISAPPKVSATEGYGATVIHSGSTSVEREAVTQDVINSTGARLVPPYDHPDIILGQGTMGLELQDQFSQLRSQLSSSSSSPNPSPKNLNAILTPCGGGGMLSGVALSCEGTPTKVFGAEPSFEGADDCTRSYYSPDGVRIESVKSLTIADGLRTPVGEHPWQIIYERRLVSGMYSVTEDQIKSALKLVYERMKLVVEPSAVVGLAVVLYNEQFRKMVEQEGGADGWDIGIVFSGGNIDLSKLGELFSPATDEQTVITA